MIIHNIDPVAFTIGVFEIRYYGMVYFLGFLFAYFFLRYQIKHARIKHMGLDDLDLFMIYFMLGSILGSRILDFVFYNPQVIFSDPLQILRVWQGGMSVHGGIIGAVVAALLFVRGRNIRFYDLADKVIIPFMLFLGLGRIANFINGELWGTRSDAWFCIDYSGSEHIANPPQGCRHPYQLYESVKNFAVGISLLIYSSLVKLKSGLLFWYGILFYNVLRFFIDIYRVEPDLFLGISMGQFLCVVFSLVAVVFIIKIKYDLVFLKKDLNNEKNHKHKKRKKH